MGRLVSTIPLSPGEKRTFKINQKVKKSRAEKEIEKSLLERSAESASTQRAELEVMSKISTSTNFKLTAEGSFSIGIGEISSTSEFAHNQAQESSKNIKAFNEATRKSAEKVRQEREVNIEETLEQEFTSEAVHEIHNPNNELTVTYLLYELERRYQVTTNLHKLTPTILVAMDIPAPHEITDAWILSHAWKLKRVLLDDSFLEPIEYIEEGIASDDLDIQLKNANWRMQKSLVEKLESQLEDSKTLRDRRRESLVNLIQSERIAEANESELDDVARAIFSGGLSLLFGQDNNPDQSEILKAKKDSVEQALKFIDESVEDLTSKLKASRAELTHATDDYSAALKEKARKDTMVSQLKLHLRENILHYMHSIWSYLHPDQLQLELYHREVPFVSAATTECTLRRATPEEESEGIPGVIRNGELYIVECSPPTPPDPTDIPKKPLGEIADLNKPLGYWGNYIIFPLKKCSHITQYMSQSYIDSYMGLKDPSNQEGFTAHELLEYAAAIWNDPEAALSEDEKTALSNRISQKLAGEMNDIETIILPSGQLYMEALKGEQSLLEDFKLAHRGMDVLAVQEQIRSHRLENLRQASRLVQPEPILDDPTVDKHIVVKGNSAISLDT